MGDTAVRRRLLHADHLYRHLPYVSPLLMLIMFAMGVTLRLDDFKRVLARPGPVAAGIFLHYLIMPLAAGSRRCCFACRRTCPPAWCWWAAWPAAPRPT